MVSPTQKVIPRKRKTVTRDAWLAATFLLVSSAAWAQTPIFDVSSGPSLVIATGRAEVLGTIVIRATSGCGNAADGRCVSGAGAINVLYVGVPIDNSLAAGISVSEIIGGVTTTAPTAGTLVTGAVTVSNTPGGGQISIALSGGVDLASGDAIRINGVRGQINLTPAIVPGTSLSAQLSAAGNVGTFSQTSMAVARSAPGVEFVSVGSGPTLNFQEGFAGAFVQHVASDPTGLPANPRPAFGATNNTQLQLVMIELPGRITWPAAVPSQLASGGGIAAGGSELRLISQDALGSQALYEFVTANQAISDTALETFAIQPVACGLGQFGVQGQLLPGESGRPGFAAFPAPSTPAAFVGATPCDPSPLVIVSGNGQIGNVSTELGRPLVVRVRDGSGNPVPAVTVTFAAGEGGGSVLASIATTDGEGRAEARAVLGPRTGTHYFTATVGSVSTLFYARAVPAEVPPTEFTTVVPHVASGAGFLTRMAVVNFQEEENPLQVNLLGQKGEILSRQFYSLAPHGRVDIATDEARRFADPTIQWAIVGSEYPIGVNVLFELKTEESAPPVTAESFSAPNALQRFTMPLAASGAGSAIEPRATGVALANFSEAEAVVRLELLDATGTTRAHDQLTLPAFSQAAFTMTERPSVLAFLDAQPLFSGSLLIASTEPIGVFGVGDDQGRLFAIPGLQAQSCWLSPYSGPKTIHIPHIVVGSGWSTRVSVSNLCSEENPARIEVFDQAGNPAPSFLAPFTTLLPGATATFFPSEAERDGPLTIRWARLTSNISVGVHVLYEFKPTPEASPGTMGVSHSPAVTEFSLPVTLGPTPEGGPPLEIGLAMANTTDSESLLELELMNTEGVVVAVDSLTLPPRGQAAVVVSELPGFRAFLTSQPQFQGTLEVYASQPVAALGVGSFGPFFAIPPLVEVISYYQIPP